MHVPKIEDGNNFGVAVQEEVLQELGRCEDFTVQSLAITTKYFLNRAKFVAKVSFDHYLLTLFLFCYKKNRGLF